MKKTFSDTISKLSPMHAALESKLNHYRRIEVCFYTVAALLVCLLFGLLVSGAFKQSSISRWAKILISCFLATISFVLVNCGTKMSVKTDDLRREVIQTGTFSEWENQKRKEDTK